MELPQNCQRDNSIKTGLDRSLISDILKESVKVPQDFSVNNI